MAWTAPRTWVTSEFVTAAQLNTHLRDNMLSVVPVGVVLPYAGTTAPTSLYLICDGSAVSRTTYADLFALIGTTYGAGDGSTTFNLPDMRGRAPWGKGINAAVDTLGDNEGATQSIRGPQHYHNVATSGTAGGGFHPPVGSSGAYNPADDQPTSPVAKDSTGLATDTANYVKDTPSYLVFNFIIKALQS